ncbi:MAG: insulinase family protein [Oscillospiraceae bacterium]|nr:insulinase family protein [Oscillospiraceae bacterium]
MNNIPQLRGARYERLVLPNGARLLHERDPGARSAALGVWVASGSRHERASEAGASHFIEHMVFKGTPRRSASTLAAQMDALGGQIDAFTTREYTCFHGRTLDTRLREMADILGDMLQNSRFDEPDVANERGVIFEEIDMYEDTPEELVSDRLLSAVFKGNALSRPILGKRPALTKMTGEFLRESMSRRYLGGDIVVALAGSYTPGDIDCIADIFSAFAPGRGAAVPQARYASSVAVKRKNLEQNHFCVAFPCPGIADEHRCALHLASDILGGGMSSRLFQSVREDRGLCYSVYSYVSGYRDTGLFSVYAALGRQTQGEALRVISEELAKFALGGVTEEELACAREQVKTNILLGTESTAARINALARGEMYFGGADTPDEAIARYDGVTADDVLRAASCLADRSLMSFSAVGKVDAAESYLSYFE